MALAVDGQIVFSEGFGYADLEERVPVWPTTKFRIGSVSKPLTAVALVQLVDQGKIDLDAPVQTYVPTFPDKGGKITPRLLAGHLAGIRHYQGDEFLMARHFDNVMDGLKIFENDPLVAPPGTKFNYSSYGFNLLGAVIQSASGQEFLAYMHQHVFGPAGASQYYRRPARRDHRAARQVLHALEGQAAAQCAFCRQQLQMGRRRLFVERGGSGAVRVRPAAAWIPEAGVAAAAVHFAKDAGRKGDGLRDGVVHPEIEKRTADL